MEESDSYINSFKMDIPDSHLQSPVRPHNRRLFMSTSNREMHKRIPRHILMLSKSCPIDLEMLEMDSERLYGLFLSDIYTENLNTTENTSDTLKGMYVIVREFLTSHIKSISMNSPSQTPEDLEKRHCTMYEIKNFWESIRTGMQHKKNKRDTNWTSSHFLSTHIDRMWVSQMYVIILDKEDQYWLLDYDQILLICDTISSRFFTHVYHYLLNNKNPAKIQEEEIKQIYAVFDQCLMDRGNDAYLEIKIFEAIIQGIMLRQNDPLIKSHTFIESITTDLIHEDHQYALRGKEKIESFNLNVFQLAELHGLYRHWGHPTVDEEKGCEKVRKIAQNRPFPRVKEMHIMKAVMIRQFCISFISMHGRWPKINLNRLNKMSSLYRSIIKNMTNINLYSANYPISDWGKLELEKEFDFDYHLDFTDLCDDKAISVYLQDLPAIYNSEVLGYRPSKPKSSRRVLIEMMSKDNIDIQQICMKIMNREVPDNWKIILLHSKERELKMEPRLFAMMVLEMRIYFCVTESNISNTIFKYFPQQTMTLSESELTRRLYGITNPMEQKAFLPIFMSIDFKSWNIHWQYLSTRIFFEQIDNLFGTPGLFIYSHIFFQESTVCLSSYFNPPDTVKIESKSDKTKYMTSCNTLWYKHQGGFEGLRQKGWTLITICLLLYVELKTGVKGYIIGQGDNQVCKLMFPKRVEEGNNSLYILSNQSYISNQIDQYISMLHQAADHLGLVVKKEETWVSSNIINYGKEILFNGAFLSQGSKRISRSLPDINEIYPTLFSKVSTLQTTGLATSQKSYEFWPSFIICQMETLLTIVRETSFSVLLGRPMKSNIKEWVYKRSSLLYILHGDPNCLNIPMLNPYSYLYRGHPDPLTTYTTFLFNNRDQCELCKRIYSYLLDKDYTLGDGDPELLISDPLSLNIHRPRQVSNMFKKHMTRSIQGIVKNKHLREIFHEKTVKEDEYLYSYLIKTIPLHPRILHEIMGLTPTGTRAGIIAKFSNTRTIQAISDKYKKESFVNKVLSIEEENVEYWIDTKSLILYPKKDYDRHLVCPTLLAKQLRNHTWKKAVKNGTIEGVTVPHPLHQFRLFWAMDMEHMGCNKNSEFILLRPTNTSCLEVLTTRGPYTPYIGSTTKEKQTGRIYQMSEISRPLIASQRALQLGKWCVSPHSQLFTFLMDTVESRTNVPLDILSLTAGHIMSGSVVHRLNDHITKRSTLNNVRCNSASHFYISSDPMGRFSRGSDNVNMHFQGALHTIISIVHDHAVCNVKFDKPLVHLHYDCKSCEEYLDDVKLANDAEPPKVLTRTNNPLLYTHLTKVPKGITPNTPCFRLISNSKSSSAAAALIFSRAIKSMSDSIWGISERSSSFKSSLSVQDIIKIGIRPILRDLAILLYLYYFNDTDSIRIVLGLFDKEIWRDLSSICLLPEVLPDLVRYAGNISYSSLFETSFGIIRLLNRALSLEVRKVEGKIKEKTVVNVTFYIVPGCGISRIFKMWANLILGVSENQLDIRDICSKIEFDQAVGLNLPSANSVYQLYIKISRFQGGRWSRICWESYPLLLSKYPPETILGNKVQISTRPVDRNLALPATLKVATYQGCTLPILSELPLSIRTLERTSFSFPKVTSFYVDKVYNDHKYSIVGDLSSSFLKIYHILCTLDISTTLPCVCLADGEGSISKLLHKITKQKVYFNSLVNTESLVPQRAISYVPSEMVLDNENICLAELSALLGGNLCNDEFMQVFLDQLPNKAGIVTMDAESSTPFTPPEQILYLRASLQVCYRTSSDWIIHKCYIDNPYAFQTLIGVMNTVYERIFICVPCYSSHETLEVYLVGTMFNPMLAESEIGGGQTRLGSSVFGYISAIKENRITQHPFQVDHSIWKHILKEFLSSGYKFNIQYNCERLTAYINPYIEGTQFMEWCECTKKLLLKLIKSELTGTGKVTTGGVLTDTEKIVLSSHPVFHAVIDKYSLAILMCKCFMAAYKIRSDIKFLDIVTNILRIGIRHSINRIPVYDFSIEYKSLKPDVKKCLWRVYGWIVYHDSI